MDIGITITIVASAALFALDERKRKRDKAKRALFDEINGRHIDSIDYAGAVARSVYGNGESSIWTAYCRIRIETLAGRRRRLSGLI